MGSDLASRLRPSTSLGRSDAILGSTATRTTGETENFIALIVCASSHFSPVIVAFLVMNWSRPTMATVLPHGTSSTASWRRPMQSTVRCEEGRGGRGCARVGGVQGAQLAPPPPFTPLAPGPS